MKLYNYPRSLVAPSSILCLCLFIITGISTAAADTIISFNLDTNPGWGVQGEWQFGVPLGQGGVSHGYPDPTAGATGSNVYGINLAGDYSTAIGGPYYLTAGPLNLSGYTNTMLRFQRWLNTDYQSFVYATVEVSNNGSTWVEVWNNGTSFITDNLWIQCEYDISSVADNSSTVYVRWSHRVASSGAFAFSGWNIDDISLLGDATDKMTVTPPEGLSSSGYQGGPFEPPSKDYTISNTGDAAIDWSAQTNVVWLDVAPGSGSLGPGESAVATVSINSYAEMLDIGNYNGQAVFTNETSGFSLMRPAGLSVEQIPPPPPAPTNPHPADGESLVSVYTLLSWNGGGGGGGNSALLNGGFETGDFTGWTAVTGQGDQFQPWTLATQGSGIWFQNGYPFEGIYFAQNGFDGSAGLYYDIYQEIAIPVGTTSAQLEWRERLQWDLTSWGATMPRPYEVTIQPAGGGVPLAILFTTTLPPSTAGDTGYVTHAVDLLTVAPGIVGQTIRFNIHQYVPESFTGPGQFDLDGVSLTLSNGIGIKKTKHLAPASANKAPAATSTHSLKDRSAYGQMKKKALVGANSTTPVNARQDSRLSYKAPKTVANVALFQNSNPWNHTRNQDILIANGISFSIFNGSSMGVVDLSGYDKVIISSVQDSGFYAQLQANKSWFENYVLAGGLLDIHAATQGDQPILPGGFGITFQTSNAVTIVDTAHPIVTTPHIITDAELDGWNSSVHCYIGTVPPDAHEILKVTDTDKPCAMELTFGLGRILVTTQTVEWTGSWNTSGASYNYLENMILYGTTEPPAIYDVYLDTVCPPQILICSDLSKPECQPPFTLAYNTPYCWQVVAKNPAGQTPGPVWTFTTEGPPGDIVVTDSISEPGDKNMPFGDQVVNTTRTEYITITNTDPANELVIRSLALSGSGFQFDKPRSLPFVIGPLDICDVNVVFAPKALQAYNASVLIASNDDDEPLVTVTLSGTGILDYVSITPAAAATMSGHPGGPFVPSKIIYTLKNSSTQSMDWSAAKTVDWLSITPADGTIPPSGSAKVTVRPTSEAATLPEGDYNDVVVFTNLTTSAHHNRDVWLHVFTAPKMWIDPPEGCINVTVRQGETLSEIFTIGNSGDADLTFKLSGRELPAQPLCAAGPMAQQITADNGEMVFEYSFDEPSIEKYGNFDLPKMKGLERHKQTIGAPMVPLRPVQILVPFGKEVVDCTVTADDVQELQGSFTLHPAQKPYPLNYKGLMKPTPPDAAIYKKNSSWPGKYFETIGTQSKRGYKVFLLNLLPLQYVPATGKVSYATKLVVTVRLADARQTAIVMPSNAAKSRLSATVDNPDALGSYPGTGNLQETAGTPLLPPGGPYQYIVITSQALKDAAGPGNFQALCDARTSDGVPATIVTTEWIYANYDGTKPNGGSDNQTRIRNFLIDAYQNWGTQYVLMGGTNAIVPARMFWGDTLEGTTDYMPVDMYYGCVDPPTCTFDNDADNLYGESTDGPGGGDVDLFAEIYVGRAAVENATELANFVGKTLTYNSTNTADSEYLPRIAMVGEYLGFGGVSDYATESMEQIRLGGDYDGYFTFGFEDPNQTNLIDFNTSGCLPGDPTCCWPLYDAPGYDWPPDRLTCLMNGGIHVFNHLGHANETYVMKLSTSDLPSLSNNDYFFVYSQGCHPGAFDTPNCFAEVLTTIGHGAFGAVMNARYGWGMFNSTDGPSQRFARQFWDAPLGEGIFEIGRANQDSKEDNIWGLGQPCIRWCLYELNLFGDPAQKFKFTQGGANWFTIAPDAGVVEPEGAQEVSLGFSTEGLQLGDHYGEITVTSNDSYSPSVPVYITMTVAPSAFAVTPGNGFTPTGAAGGPFKPGSKIYNLTNSGDEPRDWQAVADSSWVVIEPDHGTLDAGLTQTVKVSLDPDTCTFEPTIYIATVTFTDLTIGLNYTRDVNLTVTVPDFFTELFDASDNDVNHLTLTFVPDDSGNFYHACAEAATEFPVDPAGGAVLSLKDDDYKEIFVADGKLIPFYREYFDVFYVGSNGYVTFDTGDTNPLEGLEQHFMFRRIAALFDDLNPASGATVSWKQTNDEVVVTYNNVREYGHYTTNSFQIEMFFDGVIRITWLDIAARDALAGLSAGNGLADYFVESDLSQYKSYLEGDVNWDGKIDAADVGGFVEYWLNDDCNLDNGYCNGCDWSGDGKIDFTDFSYFGNEWFNAAP